MNNNQDDKKFDVFLRENKLVAPSSKKEASHIWAKISLLGLSRKSFLLYQYRILALMILAVVSAVLVITAVPSQRTFISMEVEKSFEFDSEAEDLKEVSDLLTLVR